MAAALECPVCLTPKVQPNMD